MKNILKKVIPFFFLFLSGIFAYSFIGNNLNQIKRILEVSINNFIIISLLVIATIVNNGLKNKVLISQFNIHLNKKEWFGLSVVNTFWNYLPFQGGLIAKGAYLKRQYNFPYSTYLATITASYVITFAVLGFLGIVGLIIFYIKSHLFLINIFFIYILIFLIPLIFIVYIYVKKNIKFKHLIFNRIYEGLRTVFANKVIMSQLILIDIATVILYTLRLVSSGYALGYHIPILFYFLVTPVAVLSIFTSITPGGLVIREALIGIFASWMGVNVTNSVIVSILDRSVSIIWIFVLGIIFNYILSHSMLNKKQKVLTSV